MKNKHSKNCHYDNDSCMKYAHMQLGENSYAIIDAAEVSFMDELLERGANPDKDDIPLDEDSLYDVPFKIVYGGILYNHRMVDEERTIQLVNDMVNYSFVHIEADQATECRYMAIKLYPVLKTSSNFIPFAAVMKLPFSLNDNPCSITLTPLISPRAKENEQEKEWCMWEYMVNRPFILACRKEVAISGLADDFSNLESFIDVAGMMDAYRVADLVDVPDEKL